MGDWFGEHYTEAANAVMAFLGADGMGLQDATVADIGCGDGIIDLGLAHRGRPRELVGYDLNPVDTAHLEAQAAANGVPGIPGNLRFAQSTATRLPADDDTFDVAVSWSAFEHIGDPLGVLQEVRRVLKPTGVLFLQVWPMFHSEHGGHLWEWTDEHFPHLTRSTDELTAAMLATGRPDAPYMAGEVRSLNRATIDDLQRSLLGAGLGVRRLELLTSVVHLPEHLMRYPLTDLGITGIKLLATPMR